MLVCVYDPQHEDKVKANLSPVTLMPVRPDIELDILDFLWSNPTGNVFYFYGKEASQLKILSDTRLTRNNNIFSAPNLWDKVQQLYYDINGNPPDTGEHN